MDYYMDMWKQFEATGSIINYLEYKNSLDTKTKTKGETNGNNKGDGNGFEVYELQ